MKTIIEDGESNVVEEVNKGLEFASGAEEHLLNGCEETFANTIVEHTDLIQESQWLENSLEEQAKSIANQVANSTVVVSSSVDCLGNFSRDIILVEEETPEIADRTVPPYSSQLTATKEPDVLLREAGIYEDCKENKSNDKENESNEKDSKSDDKENNDKKAPETESMQEEQRVPSSVFKDRTPSINSANTVDVSPPLKRGADRSKSNLPNASRKRYKTKLR